MADRLAIRLPSVGIHAPWQLREADRRHIRKPCMVVLEREVYEVRGIPVICLEGGRPENETIIASRSFGRPVVNRDDLEAAVAVFTSRAAEKMRREGLTCAALIACIETNEFLPQNPQKENSRAIRLPVATADTGKLIAAAHRALSIIWRPGFHFRKAGVVFLELVPATRVQGGLFVNRMTSGHNPAWARWTP